MFNTLQISGNIKEIKKNINKRRYW